MTTLSSESIASASPPTGVTDGQCSRCGSPLALDQRYCLECGERRVPVSDFLRAGPPSASAPPASPPSAPPRQTHEGPAGRNNTLTLLAGIGVLLLAMGVGVLIGRSGGGSRSSATTPTEVLTVPAASSGGAGAEETFSDDWPAGTKGYTVQLQTLPQTGTTVAAVTQAKTAASTKGASSVGALKSEDFSSLTTGNYVIYSGVYHKRAEAQHALSGLKKNFPGAKVIEVSAGGSGEGSGSTKSAGGSGGGSVGSKAAPPSVLKGESHAKGKNYEEQSKDLPDVVSTG